MESFEYFILMVAHFLLTAYSSVVKQVTEPLIATNVCNYKL